MSNQTIQDSQAPTIEMDELNTTLSLANQNMSKLIQTIGLTFPSQSATKSSFAIFYSTAGGTTIKQGSGYLMTVAVITGTTALTSQAGYVNDANNPANFTSTNIMVRIDNNQTVTNYGHSGLPFLNGLTIQPSSIGFHQVAVFYI